MDGLEKFFEKHIDNTPPNENEYIKDGFKHCKVCNKPKQCKVVFARKEYIVGCICDCPDEVSQDRENAKKLEQINNIKAGITDDIYKAMTFDKADGEIKFAKRYVENFEKYYAENIGLMIIGSKGTGKTFAAACIANALCENMQSVYMANVLSLTQQISSFDNEYILNKIKNCKLLIIDDIGAERQTDYICEQIYNIVETRYRAKKPLIITSNLTLEQLKTCEDIRLVRTYDRLKEMCHPIVMTGESRRIKKANDRFQALKSELEG